MAGGCSVAWRRDAVRLVVVWYGVAGGEGEGELCKAGSEMMREFWAGRGIPRATSTQLWVLRYGRMDREGGSTGWVGIPDLIGKVTSIVVVVVYRYM
jgi:hypothetical protein